MSDLLHAMHWWIHIILLALTIGAWFKRSRAWNNPQDKQFWTIIAFVVTAVFLLFLGADYFANS